MKWLLALATVALTACTTPPPLPDDNFYRLPMAEKLAPRAGFNGSLFLEPPTAAGVRSGRSILYSDDPEGIRINRYHHQFWEAPPAELLRRQLRAYLQQAFPEADIQVVSATGAEYRLRTQLLRYEQLRGEPTRAVVSVHAQLLERSNSEPILDRQYEQEIGAQGSSMDATVQAFSEAIREIVHELTTDIAAL